MRAERQKCSVKKCKRAGKLKRGMCFYHYGKWYRKTLRGVVGRSFECLKRRSRGKGKKRAVKIYKGLKICAIDEFVEWSMSNRALKKLYRAWVLSGYELRRRPTVNRIDPQKGYTIDNIEWMDYSQNSALAGVTLRHKNKFLIDLKGLLYA